MQKQGKDENGFINVDYFQSSNAFDRIQYRIAFFAEAPSRPPVLRRIGLAYSNTLNDAALAAKYRKTVEPGPREKWARRLPVPIRSQNWESDALQGSNRPTLHKGYTNNANAEYTTYPKDGYSRFEPGFALGGVINVMTKSGTNGFRGSALFNWESDVLIGANRPTLRKGIINNAIAEYWTYPEDEYSRFVPGFALGGPIARDKMWFFGAYQPAFTTTTRTVNSSTNGNPNSTIWDNIEQNQTVHYLTGNLTNQISDKIRTRVAYNNSWAKTEGQLPSQAGTTGQSANMAVDTTYPNWSISGNVDWVATPNF